MKSRTILIAAPYFYPKIGGLEMYAYESALHLQAAGWRVVVVCGDQVKTVTKSEHNGLTIYRLPIWKVISNTPVHPLWPLYLRRIIKSEQPAVINAHTPVPFMVDAVTLAAGRLPVVITYHAATLFKPGSLAMSAITTGYLLLQSLTLARARCIIAVSTYVKLKLPEHLKSKTDVVFNAVNLPTATTPPSGQGLIFVANLEITHRWKGLGLILEALGQIQAKTGRAPRLTVVGDGSARAEYERQAATLGLQDVVTFVGRQAGHERDELMRQAAALIAYPTTSNDAFPTVFLEAWAQGLALVAASIGPIPTLVEHNRTGILVEPNRPDALAQALVTLFENPVRLQQMGAAGRKLVTTTYNWPVQTKRLVQILEKAL